MFRINSIAGLIVLLAIVVSYVKAQSYDECKTCLVNFGGRNLESLQNAFNSPEAVSCDTACSTKLLNRYTAETCSKYCAVLGFKTLGNMVKDYYYEYQLCRGINACGPSKLCYASVFRPCFKTSNLMIEPSPIVNRLKPSFNVTFTLDATAETGMTKIEVLPFNSGAFWLVTDYLPTFKPGATKMTIPVNLFVTPEKGPMQIAMNIREYNENTKSMVGITRFVTVTFE